MVILPFSYIGLNIMSDSTNNLLSAEFEQCIDALINGDLEILKSLVMQHTKLVHMRSELEHHATLLYYVTANGVEDERQKTPENILEITEFLLQQGADPNVMSDAYGGEATLLGSLVSSGHPAEANKQADLVRLLCKYGADPDIKNHDPIKVAVEFQYTESVKALIECGATWNHIVFWAIVGDLEKVKLASEQEMPAVITAFGDVLDSRKEILDYARTSAETMGHMHVVNYLADIIDDS